MSASVRHDCARHDLGDMFTLLEGKVRRIAARAEIC